MSKFVSQRDFDFFNVINRELNNDIISTPVIVFSFDPSKQDGNMYGESDSKVYEPGIQINANIEHDDENTEYDEFGGSVYQSIRVMFLRIELKEIDFYPERGDIIKWNNSYYEIDGVVENQLVAGRPHLSFSIICSAFMVNKSAISIRGEK